MNIDNNPAAPESEQPNLEDNMKKNENDTTPLNNPDAISCYQRRAEEKYPSLLDDSPEALKQRELGLAQIEEIRKMLGIEPAIIPCYPREKRPRLKLWTEITAELNHWNPWIECVGRSENCAIGLGKHSGHLCTLDFDRDECFKEFLTLNPIFQNTLQTTGARGGNFWLIIEGDYPKNFDRKDSDGNPLYEFRADGRMTMILGTHPKGMRYRCLNECLPSRIRWEQINWPKGWEPNLSSVEDKSESVEAGGSDPLDELIDQYGNPFVLPERGGVQINQVALAEAFLTCYPLVRRAGNFFFYLSEKGIWTMIDNAIVRRELGNYMATCSKQLKCEDILIKRTDRFLREMIGHLEGRAKPLPVKAGDQVYLHFLNGTVCEDQPTTLLPFSPDYGALNQIAHDFIPAARCPRFLEFLNEALPADDVRLVQKWAGMALLGSNFAQSILLICGQAGAGKGALVDILTQIVGQPNVAQLRTNQLARNRFELSRFIAKTLLIGADVPPEFLTHHGASELKSLTGGDILHAEQKGISEGILLKGTFNVLVTSNRGLQIRSNGDEGAWARRLKIVVFEKRIQQQIPDFAERIVRDEAPGIINWMIRGLRALRRDYRMHGKWLLTEAQQERIDELIAESSSVEAFAKTNLVACNEGDCTNQELYSTYWKFCDGRGWEALNHPAFTKDITLFIGHEFQLRQRHDIRRGGKSQRGYRGIRLRNIVAEDEYVPNQF